MVGGTIEQRTGLEKPTLVPEPGRQKPDPKAADRGSGRGFIPSSAQNPCHLVARALVDRRLVNRAFAA
jgi:hypothetical protein